MNTFSTSATQTLDTVPKHATMYHEYHGADKSEAANWFVDPVISLLRRPVNWLVDRYWSALPKPPICCLWHILTPRSDDRIARYRATLQSYLTPPETWPCVRPRLMKNYSTDQNCRWRRRQLIRVGELTQWTTLPTGQAGARCHWCQCSVVNHKPRRVTFQSKLDSNKM